MFFIYVIIGLVIFAAASIIFQINKKLIYQRAVQQLLATNAAGQQLQLRISHEHDQVLLNEILRLQKHIIRQGFKNAQPANVTAKKLIEILGDRINSDKAK